VTKSDPITDPKIDVNMQYWFDAGIIQVSSTAQNGTAKVVKFAKIIKEYLKHTLRCTTATWMSSMYLISLVCTRATLFENKVHKGSDRNGSKPSDPRALANKMFLVSV
jgi:hypothetical protein